MSDVKIDADKVAAAKAQADIIEASLKTTYKNCQTLIEYVGDAKWSGKQRNAFLTYIELIQQYHQDVKSTFKKQNKALDNLATYLEDFESSSIVQTVKEL